VGIAPNRIFNVEWRAVYYANSNSILNFEVRLYEARDRFDIIYGVAPDGGNSATVGVQRDTGTLLTEFECNTSGSVSAGLQLIFLPIACATATPTTTSTPTTTRTFTPTPTLTPTTQPLLIGHVTWQGRPVQPNSLQQLPITLTLKSANVEVNYPAQTTDASGYFTVSVAALPNGTYNWRVKSAQLGPTPPEYNPGFLATSGTLSLTGGGATYVDMGLQRAGDCNNDNAVNSVDFAILRSTFGEMVGQPDYDARADFNGDTIVGAIDFALLKTNFGTGGAPPIRHP
jgi:hypothetical protein